MAHGQMAHPAKRGTLVVMLTASSLALVLGMVAATVFGQEVALTVASEKGWLRVYPAGILPHIQR